MDREFQLSEILKNIPEFAESTNEEIRTTIKAILSRALRDMDLVYQEEMDILRQMLDRTEQRVKQLEQSLDEIKTD